MRSRFQKADWNVGTAGDMSKGNLVGSLVGNAIAVDGRTFSIQFVWTNTATPVGVLGIQTSNNGGVTWDDFDDSVLFPAVANPGDGSGRLNQTRHYPLNVGLVRPIYTLGSGGAAAFVEAFLKTASN